MQMPKVTDCQAMECSYNVDSMCHALAITIGDGSNPQCDTFCQSSSKGGDPTCTATVGACKVKSCMHNLSLECQAPSISVGYQSGQVDCMTFCY